jgi:hypothetical protein
VTIVKAGRREDEDDQPAEGEAERDELGCEPYELVGDTGRSVPAVRGVETVDDEREGDGGGASLSWLAIDGPPIRSSFSSSGLREGLGTVLATTVGIACLYATISPRTISALTVVMLESRSLRTVASELRRESTRSGLKSDNRSA